ncbi:esterase-like activity of phytase family protein [Patulibacter sp.]|uniref:esterase-like activity of phytase family protein n=1 Tax=Patulibacter sp. TaxID=1912859 RepID=UPI002716634B|nr:esterase-like activity of phytase family protein [Patulibacter sp.]MDO9406826.1 esterase-like activity of phytase family protein [Patulibacter sp.]
MPRTRPRRPAAVRLALAAALPVALLAPTAAHAAAPTFQPVGPAAIWRSALALPGGDAYTPPLVEGGFSAFAPIDDDEYWTVSDRGPNGQPKVTTSAGPPAVTESRRTFLTPGFTPTIYRVRVEDDGTLTVLRRIPLKLKAGATNPAQAWLAAHPDAAKGIVAGPRDQITGLPQIVTKAQGQASGLPADAAPYDRKNARDEVPYAADGTSTLPSDPYGLDTESIAVDPRDGSFWLGDEYRPTLVHVAADGTLLGRIVPAGVRVAADSADPVKFPGADDAVVPTSDVLPRAFAYRKQNRGMEGATLSRDGRTLFGLMQSSLEPPAPGKGDERTLRLVRFDVTDPAAPKLTGEFVYRLDAFVADGTITKQGDISNSDIVALDATHLLVDEHDNVTSTPGAGRKRIYELDLAGATDLSADATQNGESPTLEGTDASGVVPVGKTLRLDLTAAGYDHDKPEGIGLFPDGDLAVQNDNDFGFEQAADPGTGAPAGSPFKVTASGKTTDLWRFTLRPVFTTEPTVTGDAVVGSTLTCADGTTVNADGTRRQWYRGGRPVTGATGTTYALTAADVGRPVLCRVTATGAAGATSADSDVVVPVPAAVPGTPGATGPKGDVGPTGPKGDTGATGDAGAPGVKGDAGATGATGPAGPRGPVGATGPKGDRGATGARGPAGRARVSCRVSSRGRRITCRVTGSAARAGTRVRLTRAGRTVAAARVSHGSVVLRPRSAVRPGRYVVVAASGPKVALRVR